MPYIVYNSNRQIVPSGIQGSQSLANTLANTNSDWSANTGDVTSSNWNELAEPGWYLNTSSKVVQFLALTELEERKSAAITVHKQLKEWTVSLMEEGIVHPISDTQKSHDFLAYAHQAIYVVMNSSNWTHAQKLTFCQNMAMGSADVTSPFVFFQKVHKISDKSKIPTEACSWVNPANGDRVNLSLARESSIGTNDVDSRGTATGGWFIGLPVTIPNVSLANGSWIENIT